ncbi:MAG: adenylate/guanylate cyclase domain-containing protein [Brevinematales bacterium]|jgi:adenylate cyclase
MAGKNKFRKLNKFTVITIISFAVLLVTGGFYYMPRMYDVLSIGRILHNVEDKSISWRFISKAFQSGTFVQAKGAIHRNKVPGIYSKMAIFALDDESISYFNGYPVDRKVWAKLLDHYGKSSFPPDLVLFDIFFDKHSRKESDKALEKSLSGFRQPAGSDFMLYPSLHSDLISGSTVTDDNEKAEILKNCLSIDSPEVSSLRKFELDSSIKPGRTTTFFKLKSIIKDISDNLSFAGFANMEPIAPGEDTFCKCPLVISAGYYYMEDGVMKITNVYYPSIALSAAARLAGAGLKDISLEEGKVVIKNSRWNGINGDFTIPVDSSFRLFVNYKAAASVGFINLLTLKYAENAQFQKNSIFLLGVSVSGMLDNKWLSPMGDMFSVEHIGYSIGTIMNKDFLLETPWLLELLYLIIFTLTIGFLMTRGTSNAIAALLLAILFPPLAGFVLFHFNIVIITLIPVITGLIALIGGEIFIILTEQSEKRFIKSTFSKYVSPDLVNILVANPEKIELGGQDTEATVLFSDIRGFTTLSEGMQPKDLIGFLNLYLTRMTNIVMETKGTLDKYIGDAVVAFWGTPIELPDHALKACQAALKMMDSMHAFNEEQVKLGNKAINIGIGLNTGNITVGNLGSEKKRNYTAIGDNMDMAEDLQDENKFYMTNIIISQFTYEKVKEWAVVRELDSIYVKGDSMPIKIYELMDLNKWD